MLHTIDSQDCLCIVSEKLNSNVQKFKPTRDDKWQLYLGSQVTLHQAIKKVYNYLKLSTNEWVVLKAFQIKLFCWYNQIIWSGKCPKQQTTMFSPSYDPLTFKSTKNLDIYNTRTLTQVILRHCGHKNQCVLLNNHACTNQFDLINLQINN